MVESIQNLVHFFLYFILLILCVFSLMNVISYIREEEREHTFDSEVEVGCLNSVCLSTNRGTVLFPVVNNQLGLERQASKFNNQEKLNIIRELKQRKNRMIIYERVDSQFDFSDTKELAGLL